MTTQTATFLPQAPKGSKPARNFNGEKELINRYVVIAKTDAAEPHKRWLELIDCRAWMSYKSDGAAPVYASIWIHDNKSDTHASGTGTARGYGYHKVSAAVQDAITAAGVKLAKPIDGVGEDAIRDALTAIAAAMGYDDVYIVD